MDGVGLGQFLVLDQVWPVLVDQCIEGQTIPPTRGEVANVNVSIAGSLHLAPEKQGVLGRAGFLVVFIFKTDVLNLFNGNIVLFYQTFSLQKKKK